MSDVTRADLSDLDALHLIVETEREAEGAAALAGMRATLAAAPKPHALTWREAEQQLQGKSYRRAIVGAERDAILFAHRFRCVTCRQHCPAEIELGHVISCREARILAELYRTDLPIRASGYAENFVPQCVRCNGAEGTRSFGFNDTLAAWRATSDSERPMDAARCREILRYVCHAETRRP